MKNLQRQVKELDNFVSTKTGKKQTAYAIAANLTSEVGELTDEIIGLEGDRVEDVSYKDKKGAAKEIVDVIYNLLRLANYYNIEVEDHWSKRLKSIKEKFK